MATQVRFQTATIFTEFQNWISLPAIKPRRDDELSVEQSPRLLGVQGQNKLPEMLNELYIQANNVWSDADLSPQGRKSGLEKIVVKFVDQIQRFKVEYLDSTVAAANRLYSELMAEVNNLKADPADVPGALLRSEIRQFLSQKNEFERLELFRDRVVNRQDLMFLLSVMEGAYLELVKPKFVEKARHLLAIHKRPELAKRYLETKEAGERLGIDLIRIIEVIKPYVSASLSISEVDLPDIDIDGRALKRLIDEAAEEKDGKEEK